MRLRRQALTWQVVGDEVIVLDLDGSLYLKVNGSGRVLWEALAEAATTDSELIDLLVSGYDIDRSRASADVAAFLADLRSRGLIEE